MKMSIIAILSLITINTVYADSFDVPLKSEIYDRGYGLEVTFRRAEGVVVPPNKEMVNMTKPGVLRERSFGSRCRVTLKSPSAETRIIKSGRKLVLNKITHAIHWRNRINGKINEANLLNLESTDDQGISGIIIDGLEYDRSLPLLDLEELKRICDLDFKVVPLEWTPSQEI